MSVRIMVTVAAAATLLGAAPAFAGDLRPAAAVFSPLDAAKVPLGVPGPAKHRVRKKHDVAGAGGTGGLSAGGIAVGVTALGAVIGGVVSGTTGSSLPATNQ